MSRTSHMPCLQDSRKKPLAIDLYAGLGGWTEGLLAEGWQVVGFDVEQHVYGEQRYPAQLVLQDVRTIHGKQFRDAHLIVASSPCQRYSWMAMPWSRAKQVARALRGTDVFPDDWTGPRSIDELNELFEQPARIQREACEAAGRFIPMIQENVRGAQPWVGPSTWHFGSFHLWGDVPALMPMITKHVKVATMGAGWYPPGHPKHVAGLGFNTHADRATKNTGGSWFNVAHNTTSGKGRNPDGRKNGGDWFGSGAGMSLQRRASSKSSARKRAAASIAKIPFALSSYVAQIYYPTEYREGAA